VSIASAGASSIQFSLRLFAGTMSFVVWQTGAFDLNEFDGFFERPFRRADVQQPDDNQNGLHGVFILFKPCPAIPLSPPPDLGETNFRPHAVNARAEVFLSSG